MGGVFMLSMWRVVLIFFTLAQGIHAARPHEASLSAEGKLTKALSQLQQTSGGLEAARQETVGLLEHHYRKMLDQMDADRLRAHTLHAHLQIAKKEDALLTSKIRDLKAQRMITSTVMGDSLDSPGTGHSFLQMDGFDSEDADGGRSRMWKPLTSKSSELETQLAVLNDKQSQAQVQIHEMDLELRTLQDSLAMNEIIAPALKKQIDALKTGKDQAIRGFLEAMQDAQAGDSLLSISSEEAVDDQDSPVDFSARKGVVYSQNLEATLETLEDNFQKLQAQIQADTQRAEVVRAQLDEDKRMDAALKAQIDKIQEGRQESIDGLQGAMVNAHKTGDEKMKEGLSKEPAFVQMAEEEHRLAQSAAKLSPLPPSPGAYENGIWKPLQAKSAELEKEMGLLQQQREKVGVQIIQYGLELSKLEENLAVNQAVSTAMAEQIKVLKGGRKEAILKAFQTMSLASEALASASSSDTTLTTTKPTGMFMQMSNDEAGFAQNKLTSTRGAVKSAALMEEHYKKVVNQLGADAAKMKVLESQLDEGKRRTETLKAQIDHIEARMDNARKQNGTEIALLEELEATRSNLKEHAQKAQDGLKAVKEDLVGKVVAEQALKAQIGRAKRSMARASARPSVKELPASQEERIQLLQGVTRSLQQHTLLAERLKAQLVQLKSNSESHVKDSNLNSGSVLQVKDEPYPNVNIWGYDGLEGRSNLMMRRVGELENQLDRVTSEIGWEKIQKDRLEASIKEHTADQAAIRTEAEQLRRYRKETEQSLRGTEIEASQAGQEAASNTSDDEPSGTGTQDTDESSSVSAPVTSQEEVTFVNPSKMLPSNVASAKMLPTLLQRGETEELPRSNPKAAKALHRQALPAKKEERVQLLQSVTKQLQQHNLLAERLKAQLVQLKTSAGGKATAGKKPESVMQLKDEPYPNVNIWGYDGLEGRSDLMMRRVGELERQLDRVTSEIGWETIQKERLEASIKEHTADQTAIRTEAEQLRRYRKETEQKLRSTEIEASQAGQEAASNTPDSTPTDTSVTDERSVDVPGPEAIPSDEAQTTTPKSTEVEVNKKETTTTQKAILLANQGHLLGLSSSYPGVNSYSSDAVQQSMQYNTEYVLQQATADGTQQAPPEQEQQQQQQQTSEQTQQAPEQEQQQPQQQASESQEGQSGSLWSSLW